MKEIFTPNQEGTEIESGPKDKQYDDLLQKYGFRFVGKNEDGFVGDLYEKDGEVLLVETEHEDFGAKYVKIKSDNGFKPLVEGWGATSPEEFETGWLKKRYTLSEK